MPLKPMTFSHQDHLIVRLKNVVVETRCGIHPWEQHPERPNKLSIDISLFAGLEHRRLAAFGFIDYDHIRDFLRQFPDRPHTPLLETLLDEIVDKCFADDRVEACHVSITKLNIFNEAQPGVEVYRTRAMWK
jgi:7,8-dihydroneopterin aldolase/epimerase/oxygenase